MQDSHWERFSVENGKNGGAVYTIYPVLYGLLPAQPRLRLCLPPCLCIVLPCSISLLRYFILLFSSNEFLRIAAAGRDF